MKKRLVSALLALSMLCSALPAPAFAQGADSAGLEQEHCSCSIRCTADGMNPDCPVCAADAAACGAGLDPATVETADPEPTPEATATPVPTETPAPAGEPAPQTLGAAPSLLAANDEVSTLAREGTKLVGQGTQEDPYQISTDDDLFWFAGLVNGTLEGVAKNTAACAVLTTNITISEGRAWTPIGNSIDNQYTGTFDGAGYTIDNLKIEPTENDQGFVGYLGSGGAIQNLTMGESCSVSSDDGISVGGVCGSNESGTIENCTNRGTVSGFGTVGGVCGLNGGTLTGCTNSGKVTGNGNNVGGVCGINQSTITGCTNSGEVTGSSKVGGVCGENMGGTIQNCTNKAEVTGSSKVGGVCSENYGPITGCTNSGAVSGGETVGGLCGYNSSNITYCYSTGTVTSNGNNVGGVCGFNGSAGALTNCYWLDTAYSDNGVGTNNNGTVNNVCSKTDTAFSSGAVCWLLNRGSADSPVWYQNLGTDTYPVLDSSHGTVYCIDKGLSFYSNDSNAKLDISGATVALSQERFTYNGTVQKPTVTVTLDGKTLTENTHYTVAYSGNCIDAVVYTVTVTGTAVCSGTVSKKYTIYPAEISIASATVQGKTYDGTTTATVESVEFTGLVNGEGLTPGKDYTATATFADKSAGENKTATVTVELKNGNYTFVQGGNTTTATATARIAPLPVELSWSTPISFTYDGSEHSVTAKVSNAVDGDTFTLTYEDNTGTAVGEHTATVTGLTGADAANYTIDGVENLTQAWSIASASLAGAEVTLDESTFTYTGSEQKPTVTVKLGGKTLNADTDYDVDFGGESINAGTYTVTVTGKGNYSGEAESQTYTIEKATVTPSISGTASKPYDGTTAATGLSITLNGVVSADAVTAEAASYAYDSANAGGNKTITASGITLSGEDAGNYTLSADTATTTGTITPAALTVTAEAKSKTYGDADPELTYQVSGLVGEDKLTGALSRAEGENVGEHAITQGTLAAGSNYTLTFTGADLTITARIVTLSWSETTSFTYDGSEHSINAQVSNAVNGDTFTLTYENNAKTDVGSYTAKVTGLGNANYTLTGATGTEQAWNIVGASIAEAEVTLVGGPFTYNGSEQKPGVIVTLNGKALDAGTDYDVDFGGDSTNVGTVTVTVTGKGNYSGTATEKPTYTINPAPLTISGATLADKTYDGTTAATVTGVTFTEVQGSDALTLGNDYTATAKFDTADAGTGKTATVTVTLKNGNYKLASDTYQLTGQTIAKANAAVTAAPTAVADLTYNGQAQTLVTAGTATGGTMVYSLEQNGKYAESIPTGTNAGDYTVWYKVAGDANHNDTAPASEQVTIAKKAATVTVQLTPSNRIKVGDKLPDVELVYTGLVDGESITAGTVELDNMPTDSNTIGNYQLMVSQATQTEIKTQGNNYSFTFTDVTLTILEKEVVVLPEPEVPDAEPDTGYRLEQSELTVVPAELNQKYSSVNAIQDAMYEVAVKALPGVTAENTELNDVTLYVSEDGGQTWIKADKNNFPANGITVTLPYPDGTNAADYDFVVTHMATVAMNGLGVGEVETPDVTKTEKGLQFTVRSLSPVAVSWKLAPKTESSTGSGESTTPAATPAPTATPAPDGTTYYTCPKCGYHDWTATDTGYRCDTCGYLETVNQLTGYGNVKGVYEPKTGSNTAGGHAVTVPQTGDTSNPALWLGLLLLSGLALGGITLYRRKKTQ